MLSCAELCCAQDDEAAAEHFASAARYAHEGRHAPEAGREEREALRELESEVGEAYSSLMRLNFTTTMRAVRAP